MQEGSGGTRRSAAAAGGERVPVRDGRLAAGMTVRALVDNFAQGGGFSAKHVAVGSDIVRRMRSDDATVLLSFPAALMATGCRGTIVQMVQDGLVDAIVTTCGTLDHDLARTWRDYYHGSWDADDALLHRQGVNRLGNVFVPNESYGEVLEERLGPWLSATLAERPSSSTAALCKSIGEFVGKEPRGSESLLAAAAAAEVPVFVPGIMDGAVGSQIWLQWQKNRKISIDLLADEHALYELVHRAERLGAIMVGGGISKHHVIWWSQFREGLDYAVYITTAVEWDGSLSGAKLEEAVSWGKVKEDARIVNIPGDATLVLPLLYAASL